MSIVSEEVPVSPPSAAALAYAEGLPQFPVEPIVGFNGADIGYGPGDGVNELVPMTFYLPEVDLVLKARLRLDLTIGEQGLWTDAVAIAGGRYGRPALASLMWPYEPGDRVTIEIDLAAASGVIVGPSHDREELLSRDQLDLVYLDDAIIHDASLRLTGLVE